MASGHHSEAAAQLLKCFEPCETEHAESIPVQCLALKRLHYDEGVSVVLLDLVDRTHVGVIKGGCSPGLALESF